MQKKREDNLLFFSLLIIIVCNNIKAMDTTKPKWKAPPSPADAERKSITSPATRKRRSSSGSHPTDSPPLAPKDSKSGKTRPQKTANSPVDPSAESHPAIPILKRTESYPELFSPNKKHATMLRLMKKQFQTKMDVNNGQHKERVALIDETQKEYSEKHQESLNLIDEAQKKITKEHQETQDLINETQEKGTKERQKILDSINKQNKKQNKITAKEAEFLKKIKPTFYTLGTLSVAMGIDHLLHLPVTEKRNEGVETLRQSVVDVKELEMYSLYFGFLDTPLHRVINGYNEVGNIAINSILNFAGETANAFALRYLRKPIANRSEFIINRLKHSKNSVVKTAYLKYSKYPIVKTVLKDPRFRYSVIRGLWRLE